MVAFKFKHTKSTLRENNIYFSPKQNLHILTMIIKYSTLLTFMLSSTNISVLCYWYIPLFFSYLLTIIKFWLCSQYYLKHLNLFNSQNNLMILFNIFVFSFLHMFSILCCHICLDLSLFLYIQFICSWNILFRSSASENALMVNFLQCIYKMTLFCACS